MTRVLDNEVDDDVQADRDDEADADPRKRRESRAVRKRPFYRRPLVLLIGAVLLVIGLLFGLRYYVYARTHESTDDAFVDGEVIQISPNVSGHVLRVYVSDNQRVKKGDLLVEIDPRDFQTGLEQARANLQEAESRHKAAAATTEFTRANTRAGIQQASSGVQAARSGVQTAQAEVTAARGKVEQAHAAVAAAQSNVQQANAQIVAAQAEAARANADLQRYQQLYELDEVTRQQFEQVTAAARTANANLIAARTRAAAAEAQVTEARAAEQSAIGSLQQSQSRVAEARAGVGEAAGRLASANTAPQQLAVSQSQAQTAAATIEQAQAALKQAEIELSYTRIVAPDDGFVTRKSIEEGQYIQTGQTMMALVTGDVWVTANFKETQLDELREGQPAAIKIDAYPGRVFAGHVDSIQRASGSRFSLLPPENATGNYVKVVQRVPVKIVFDQQPDPQLAIGPGMSVVPEVKVK
jgi:membrane fusion protein (multidrug efflux system)